MRWQPLKTAAGICLALLVAVVPACSAQSVRPSVRAKKAAPKPEPTAQDVFEYIRGALLSMSPDDGINDNLDVKFNETTRTLTVTQPDGHCDQFMGSLDSNYVVWDVFDPSSTYQSRERLLRVTLVSVSDKTARTCYNKLNLADTTVPANRARLLFSLSKVQQVPGFQDKMTKALKKLIVLSGGAPPNTVF